MALLLATSLTSVSAAKAPQPHPPQASRFFAGQSENLQRRRRQEGPDRGCAATPGIESWAHEGDDMG